MAKSLLDPGKLILVASQSLWINIEELCRGLMDVYILWLCISIGERFSEANRRKGLTSRLWWPKMRGKVGPITFNSWIQTSIPDDVSVVQRI
jgi:hypothetical protein